MLLLSTKRGVVTSSNYCWNLTFRLKQGHYPYSFQIYKKKISILQNDRHFYSEQSEEPAQNLTGNQKKIKGHDFHVCLKNLRAQV